jgi:uncharacterized protein DUF3159
VNPGTTPDAALEVEPLPSFSEQVASQLGGVRGMIESSIPVTAFVVTFLIWHLNPALIVSVATAVALAGYRLSRRQSVRHAVNGLVGIGIGALVAWRTGSPKDFYLPGILMGLAYGLAMVTSIAVRRPLVGWLWSVVADQGLPRWRTDPRRVRMFGWLTLLWASIYFVKAAIQLAVYLTGALTDEQKASLLGVIRIALGYPPYALLLAVTVWAVRRHGLRYPVVPA